MLGNQSGKQGSACLRDTASLQLSMGKVAVKCDSSCGRDAILTQATKELQLPNHSSAVLIYQENHQHRFPINIQSLQGNCKCKTYCIFCQIYVTQLQPVHCAHKLCFHSTRNHLDFTSLQRGNLHRTQMLCNFYTLCHFTFHLKEKNKNRSTGLIIFKKMTAFPIPPPFAIKRFLLS